MYLFLVGYNGANSFQRAGWSNDPLMSYVQSRIAPSESGRTHQTDRSDLSSWELNFQDLEIQQPIGEGSWGRVYMARWHETNVAVKVLLQVQSNTVTDSATAAAAVSSMANVLDRLGQVGISSVFYFLEVMSIVS